MCRRAAGSPRASASRNICRETVNRRIRLMLHLPVANTRLVLVWSFTALRRSPFSYCAVVSRVVRCESAALFPAEITLPALKSEVVLVAGGISGLRVHRHGRARTESLWALLYATHGILSHFRSSCGEAPGPIFVGALCWWSLWIFPVAVCICQNCFSKGER